MHPSRVFLLGVFVGVASIARADGQQECEAVEVPSSVPSLALIDPLQAELDARIARLEALTREDSAAHGSGLSGGAELIFFKPCGEAGASSAIYVGNVDFLPAWRLWGAASNEEGQGLRVRWWQYDQNALIEQNQLRLRLIFQKLDLEATQQVKHRHWELLLSGGLTYAGNGLQPIDTSSEAGRSERWRFDGVGVTCGAQAIRRSVRLPAWSLFGTVQWSGVYGNSVVPGGIYGPASISQPGTCASILEVSIGPRWERSVGGGTVLYAGGGVEAQYWTTGLGSEALYFGRLGSFAGDIGLIGLTFSLGLRR